MQLYRYALLATVYTLVLFLTFLCIYINLIFLILYNVMVPSSFSKVVQYPNLYHIIAVPKKSFSSPIWTSILLYLHMDSTNHFIKNIDKFLQLHSATVVVIEFSDQLIYLW